MASPPLSPAAAAPSSAAPAHPTHGERVVDNAHQAAGHDEADEADVHELEPEPEEDEDVDEDEEEEQPGDAGEHFDEDEGAPLEAQEEETAAPSKLKGRGKGKKPAQPAALGTTSFPLSRVTKILKADEGLDHVSREATFLIAIASELFLKTVAERAYAMGRLEKRRYIAYGDVQNVVAKDPHWSYLRDVVPDPVSYGDALSHREQLARYKSNAAADFFAVPPAPGLERNPYAEGYDHGMPPHPLAYGEEGGPLASGESDIEMKEA